MSDDTKGIREGDFLEFWANSKRFEPYTGDVIDDEKTH